MKIHITLNGSPRDLEIAPAELLFDALRRIGVTGVKRGCGTGVCGACTVLLDGRPVVSCQLFAAKADGRSVTTIEGLEGPAGEPHPLQRAFVEAGAVQCGFCIPGMILSAAALLASLDREPTDDEVKEALAGNVCRCTGYVRQIEAVRAAARELLKGGEPA